MPSVPRPMMIQTDQHPKPGECTETDDAMGGCRCSDIDLIVVVACMMERPLQDLEVEQKEQDRDGEEEQDASHCQPHLLACSISRRRSSKIPGELQTSHWWHGKMEEQDAVLKLTKWRMCGHICCLEAGQQPGLGVSSALYPTLQALMPLQENPPSGLGSSNQRYCLACFFPCANAAPQLFFGLNLHLAGTPAILTAAGAQI